MVASQSPLSALQRLSVAHRSSGPAVKPSLQALVASSKNPARYSTTPPKMAFQSANPSPGDMLRTPTVPSKLAVLAKEKASKLPDYHISHNSLLSGERLNPELTSSTAKSTPTKLALKVQKARQKSVVSPSKEITFQAATELNSVFSRLSLQSNANPSEFARVLLQEVQPSQMLPLTSDCMQANKSSYNGPFAFDTPSPDDLVFRVRRGIPLDSRLRS